MKRTLPPHLELSVPPRRKRALTDDERDLWESVAKQTKPLRRRPRSLKPQVDTPKAIATATTPADISKSSLSLKIAKVARLDGQPPAPQLAPLGRRERSRLSRGKNEIEARLDLHGMTQTRAHRALLAFLQNAHSDGLTFVLVITGKGRTTGMESERGILRRQVPLWLGLPEFRLLVVGFEEAHIGHGGGGALYVRIRRAR